MLRDLKSSGWLVLVILGAGAVRAVAADATTPIDYTQRNTPYAPQGSVTPDRQSPAANRAPQQDRRVQLPEIGKTTSPLSGRKAGVDVTETRDKAVRESESHRPETLERKTSAFDAKTGPVSTEANQARPPLVAKYNDSMIAASAANMARFPAVDAKTTAKINRFVFRKNPSEPVGEGARVVPAAGGSAVPK